MTDLLDKPERYRDFHEELEELVRTSSRDELAECARLMAVKLAYYQQAHGELGLRECQTLLNGETLERSTREMALVLTLLRDHCAVSSAEQEAPTAVAAGKVPRLLN
ncbi:MAG: hypothetical protein DRQ37_04890 [Gammaproteobacteria bacterium]|nr:MAG: hypothetical protein DRQ37_04890 [Gammaproteobacteria bacterium]